MTSTPNELTSRLRRRLEADHRQIEETAASELRRLGESLSAVVNDALRTIEADTASAVGRLSALLRRAWLPPLVVGLSLSLGIAGGSWAGTRWLWTTIEQQIEALAVLRVDIKEARATLARIEETTWSGQFETEQRRHSGQVEALQQRFEQQAAENRTLRQRIEQLSGQLRCLDEGYRTLSETLRGPWS